MNDYWCVSGRYIGYRDGDRFFDGKTGRCIGSFRGNELFAQNARYLGDILPDDRIGYDPANAGKRGGITPLTLGSQRSKSNRAKVTSNLLPFDPDRK
jgi:hypothetical protein